MALQVPVTSPGGFTNAAGYRRAVGFEYNRANSTLNATSVDYKDAARRQQVEGDYFNKQAYGIGKDALKSVPKPTLDETGNPVFLHTEATPSFAEFTARPVSDFLAGVSPTTPIGAILDAILYGRLKESPRNAGAVDV